jgi:hypothetical protein
MKKRSMRLNTHSNYFNTISRALPLSYLLTHSLFSFIYILYNMAHQNPFHDPPYSQDYQSSPRPGSGLGYPPTNQSRRGSQYLDPHAADLGYRQQEDWRGEEEDELKPLNS